MNERKEKAAQNKKQTQGNPSFRVLRNILGACPRAASPYKVLDDTNRSAVPADHALVRRAALIIEGRTEIPEFCLWELASWLKQIFLRRFTWMAMTKGLFAAVEARLREGSDGDTRSPICGCQ
jgi:hypothetical protein